LNLVRSPNVRYLIYFVSKVLIVVYYEEIKQELNRILMYECRWERPLFIPSEWMKTKIQKRLFEIKSF
jgi:hypothetical protein